jgi:phosphatidate cytidylyltransferase
MNSGAPSPNPVKSARRNWADVGPRLVSAAVLIAVTATALYLGGFVFSIIVGAVYAGVYREWETMVSRAPLTPAGMVLIGLVGLSGLMFPLFGVLGLAAPIILACVLTVFMQRDLIVWRILGLTLFGLLILSAIVMRGEAMTGVWAGVFRGEAGASHFALQDLVGRPRWPLPGGRGRTTRLDHRDGFAMVDWPDHFRLDQPAWPAG